MKWAEIFTRNEKGFRRKTRVGEEAGAKKGSANWMIETRGLVLLVKCPE